MRINIASFGGRTHMLDTARELEKLGHDVRFYSFVPTKRAMKFGLKKECNKSYFILALPFLALQKLTHRSFWSQNLFQRFFDVYVALVMPRCDVFIGQSPLHVYALKRAKKKYNAITIIEQGASHILTSIKIRNAFLSNQGKCVQPDYFARRELKCYELADYISIASDFQKRSFINNGVNLSKLIINPYGTDLSQFYPIEKPDKDAYDVLMVGNWSYRKGCDLIVDAVKKLNIRFLHVGSLGDLEFPDEEGFTHVPPVNQWLLIDFYKKAKIFVLASKDEGFGMVLSQAVACGLPVVCARNTGGPDLKSFLGDKKWIVEMPEYSVDCLADCIQKALLLANSQPEGEQRNYAGEAIQHLTWEAYGKRYNENIERITEYRK